MSACTVFHILQKPIRPGRGQKAVHKLTLRAVTYLPIDRQCDAFLGQCWLVCAESMKAALTLLAPQTSAHVKPILLPDNATMLMTLILHGALCNTGTSQSSVCRHVWQAVFLKNTTW